MSFTDAFRPLLSTEAYVRSEPPAIVISSDSTVTFACLPLEVLSMMEVRSNARTEPLCILPSTTTSTSSVSVNFTDFTVITSPLDNVSALKDFSPVASPTTTVSALSPTKPIFKSGLLEISVPDL